MSGEYFVSDYRPTKRIGIEELDGAIKLLIDRIDGMQEYGEADYEYYEGAMLALETIRYGNFKYPHEFMAVLVNKVQAYTE